MNKMNLIDKQKQTNEKNINNIKRNQDSRLEAQSPFQNFSCLESWHWEITLLVRQVSKP